MHTRHFKFLKINERSFSLCLAKSNEQKDFVSLGLLIPRMRIIFSNNCTVKVVKFLVFFFLSVFLNIPLAHISPFGFSVIWTHISTYINFISEFMMTVIERGQEVDYEWRHLIPNNCFLKFYPIPNRLKEFCAKERFILFKFYYFQNLKKNF